MPRFEFSRRASLDEMAREIDRRGAVIEKLEATIAELREAAKGATAVGNQSGARIRAAIEPAPAEGGES